MADAGNDERQRILDMVQSGTVSPEEGERLLTSLEQRNRVSQRCPFCAEEIPAQAEVCPECRTPLSGYSAGVSRQPGGNGFHALTGLGKFLVCYTILMCAIIWLMNPLQFVGGFFIVKLLALLGLVGAVLICKGVRAGWVLCIIWSLLQMIPFIVNGIVLNRQILHVGINWTTNGSGFGFNAVGLVLLILFIKAKPANAAVPWQNEL